MDSLGEDLLTSVVELVQTNMHACVSKAFLQAQLQRREGSLTMLTRPRNNDDQTQVYDSTKLLPRFLWSGGSSRQLHLVLYGNGFRLPANLDASACVVRRLSVSSECWSGQKLHECMPGLSSLCLLDVNVDITTGIKGLEDLTDLELLGLGGGTDASIGAMLSSMTRLRSLILYGAKTELLRYVGRMTWLEKLDVMFIINARPGSEHIPSMLALLAPLRGLGLTMLYVGNGGEGGSFGGGFTGIALSLAGLTGLTQLRLSVESSSARDEADVFRELGASLAKLPELTELDIDIAFAGRDVSLMLDGLLGLRRLRSLHLSDADGREWDQDMGFSAASMASLAPVLEGLTELRFGLLMDAAMVRAIPMSCMAMNLVALSLKNCKFEGGGLVLLANRMTQLTALRRLDMSCTNADDEAAAELAYSLVEMQSIKSVKLDHNHISVSMGRMLWLALPPSIWLSLEHNAS